MDVGKMDGWNEWMDEQGMDDGMMDGCWKDGWMDGMNGWMNKGWVDVIMDE